MCPAVCAGVATVNSKYGTRTAVMLGDFLFAQSSWFLANLNNLEVCTGLHSVALPGLCIALLQSRHAWHHRADLFVALAVNAKGYNLLYCSLCQVWAGL